MPSITSITIAAYANHPQAAQPLLTGPCHAANADSNEPIPRPSSVNPPPSNIFKLGVLYPPNWVSKRLEGRALVRLKVAETGTIASAEFLQVEAHCDAERCAADRGEVQE